MHQWPIYVNGRAKSQRIWPDACVYYETDCFFLDIYIYRKSLFSLCVLSYVSRNLRLKWQISRFLVFTFFKLCILLCVHLHFKFILIHYAMFNPMNFFVILFSLSFSLQPIVSRSSRILNTCSLSIIRFHFIYMPSIFFPIFYL